MRFYTLILCVIALQLCVYVCMAEICEPGAVCKTAVGGAKSSSTCTKTEDCATGEQCLANGKCGTVGAPFDGSPNFSGRDELLGVANAASSLFHVCISVVFVMITLH